MKGRTLPRVYTRPLPGRTSGDGCVPGCACGLTPQSSRGFEVIAWAKRHGIRLRRWQRWLLIHALELDQTGRHLRFHVVLVLVARQNGKTLVKMVLTLYRMFADGARLCIGTAQDLSQAREVMNEGLVPLMQANPKLSVRFDPDNDDPDKRRGIWHKTLNDEYFRLDSRWFGGRAVVRGNEPRYLIKALNRKAGRGLWGVREVNIDELREQRDFLGWASVSKVVMAQEDAQICCMSNAGDRQSVLLNHLRATALAGNDHTLFHAEWSATPGCELNDRAEWAQANPSLGYGLAEASILSAMRTDPPEVFRTEVLCQFVDSMSAAIDSAGWQACADRGSSPMGLGGLALVADVAVGGTHVTACVAAESAGRVALARVGAWHDTTSARSGIRELARVLRPSALGWFPVGPGAVLGATMRKLKAREIRGTAVAEACMTLADAVEQRRLLHDDDPLVSEQISWASRLGSRGAWMFDRSSPDPCDAAYAAAGAVHLALNSRSRRIKRQPMMPSESDV